MADVTFFAPTKGETILAVHHEMFSRALGGTGVVDGNKVSPSAGLAVTVDAGRIAVDAVGIDVEAASAALDAADATNPRVDVVVRTAAGSISIVTGAPAAIVDPLENEEWHEYTSPAPSDVIPAGVILGAAYVAPGATSLSADDIWMFAGRVISEVHIQGTDQTLDLGGENEASAADVRSAVSAKHTQGTDQHLDAGGANQSSAADVKDAVTKKHTQNTDQYLDFGGANQSTAPNVKDAVTKKHTQNTDQYLDYGGGNQCAVTDVKDAVTKKHTQAADDNFNGLTAEASPATGDYLAIYDVSASAYRRSLISAVLSLVTSGVAFWSTVLGTPTRIGDTSFSITDTGGAFGYASRFPKGTLLTWMESETKQYAMVVSATYAANAVTVTIVGNSLTAGFTAMKYCIHRAEIQSFEIPGFQPGNTATTNISRTWYPESDVIVLSADARVGTAASGSSTVWDVNDDGSTIFTTKPTITSGSTSDLNNVCNCVLGNTVASVAAGSAVTIDYDSGNATTPAKDAIITLYYMPLAWGYES